MKFHAIIPVLALALAAGCASEKKHTSAPDKVRSQWSAARAGVMYGLSKQHFENGNLAEARKNVDESLKLEPTNVQSRLLSARISIEQGKLDAATRDLESVRGMEPQNAEADYLMGVIYQRWQKPAEALKWYSQAAEKSPLEPAYVLARAETLVAQGEVQVALDYLKQRLGNFESNAAIRDGIGQLQIALGQYAEAAQTLRDASMLSPEDLLIREHLAFALYYSGQYREASPLFDRLISGDVSNKRADLYLAHGECLLKLGRLEDARESFQTAARMQPSQPYVYLQLAKVALQLNDLERAEMSLTKAAALDSNNSEMCVMAGYLRLKQNRLGDALGAFQKASQLDPADSFSHCMVGYVLEKQGKSRDALRVYGEVLKQSPNDELATTLMAQIQVHE